ncbi:MAG TPA: hypothetical protein VIS51_03280 [Solirubrobacterales bacterium]
MILKRLRTRIGVPVALMAVLAMAIPAAASADELGANTEFSAPEAPTYPTTLTEGPDGNIWFTDPAHPALLTGLKIGKVTPAGAVSLYSPGLSGGAWGIAKGPDGDIWFTEPLANKVGHIDPAEPTTSLVEIELPKMSPEGSFKSLIAAGPDGNLWVTQGTNGLARITPAGVVTEYPTSTASFNAEANVCSVTAGPDGNVWFGDCGPTKAVGKITPAGVVTEYSVVGDASTNQPVSIALGSDNRLWFPANNAPDERLGAITTAGVVSYYKTPTAPEPISVSSLTAGPDGNIWATETTGINETQKATIKGEGTFKLGFEGQQTGWTGTGTLSSSSTSVTGVSTSTGSVVKHELITGPGIKPGTKINACSPTTCINPTALTLSQATEAGAGGSQSLSADLAFVSAFSTCALNTPCATAIVREALGKLSTIGGTSNVTVGGLVEGSTLVRTVTFAGKFERSNVATLTCDGSKLTGAEAGCTVETTVNSLANRLFRIKPVTGAMKEFSLKAATALQPTARTNALAIGPGGNVWYTSIGLPPAIGKFGTESSEFELTVNKEGTGDGTVVSNPAGIECDPTCSAEFKGVVILTASPDADSLFVSWKGCDKLGANGRQCTVTMTGPKTVSAKFTTAYDVSVTRKGTGLGKVSSSPGGVLCLSNCSSTSAKFKELTNVTLNAAPSKNFTFAGWSGDCEGTGPCVLNSLSEDKDAEAEFVEVAKHLLTVTKKGGGQGTAKSNLAGINCGATCSSMASAYYQGAEVELTATPGKGSTFGGWSGGGCSGTGTCKVTMSSAKSVEAEFK